MSTVGTITKLATEAVGKAAHVVTHPVATVTTVAGQARKVAATVVGGGHQRTGQQTGPEPTWPAAVTPDPTAAAEEAVAAERARAEDTAPVETDATEAETEIRTPAGTTAAGPGFNPDTAEADLHQPDTEPLMDPSLTKAIKSEADTMRKAADPNSEG